MKIKNFLVKNKDYLLIIATIVVIIFSLFIIKGVFPFGRNTIAHYDMIGQTIPLSELIFDWFKGESPLFYSTSIGLGANTFGYLIYFILSPFNLLILLGGSGNLLFSVSIVFLFKLVTIGCVACWFIKKYFKNVGSLLTIAFSVAYTFCGYMLFNYTYLSFIDYLIYAPIFIYTFTLLKDENKIWPMALIVFLMILSCFSLGCFVLIYLAVIFSAYIFIVVKKEDRKNLILKVIASVLIGLALASPILVPAFWQFLSSARNAGISIFNTAFAVGTATKIGVIITDIVALFFGILYFVKCDKKDSFNKFLISVGVLTLITTFSDESLMMFNGGATFGYYSRFGFVGAIYTLSLACLYFDKIYKPAEKNIKQTSATNYAIVAIYSVIFVLLVFIFKTNLSNIIRSQKLTREALWEYLPIFVMIVIPFLLILFTKKTTGNQLKIVASIFAILVSFGGGVFHITNNVNGTNVYTQTSQVFEQIDKDYRVKFVADNYIALNATTMGVKSLGTFSSLNDKKFNETLTKLGYFHSTNWVKSIGGTLLSDIFVGNKYIFSQSKMDYNHLNLLEEKDGYYLYENLLCGKLGKVLQQDLVLTEDIIENQNVLFHSLGGSGDLLEKVNPTLTLKDCYLDENGFYNPTKENSFYEVKIEYNLTNDKLLYIYIDPNFSSIKNYLGFENKLNIDSDGFFQIFNDEFLTLKIEEQFDSNLLSFYELDLQKIENLNYQSFDVEEIYGTLNANVNLTENSTVVLPYINIEGYTVKTNGEILKNNSDSFIIFDLSQGENNLTVEFKNYVGKYFLIGLAIGLVLSSIGILIFKFRNKFNEKFINIAFVVFAATLAVVFVVFPVGVTIVKGISLI